MKNCPKCGEIKQTSEFGKDSGLYRGGLKCWCKSCVKTAEAKRRADHPEKVKASVAKYQSTHPEWHRARVAKWRADHPEEAKAYAAEYGAKYRADNPEACRINEHNRRAREMGDGGRLSKGLAEKLFKLQRGKRRVFTVPVQKNRVRQR